MLSTQMSSPVLAKHIEDRNAAFRAQHPAAAEHYLNTVLVERSAVFAQHVASMTLSPTILHWAMLMGIRYETDYVRVHYFIADWITALLIVRYGEEPDASKSTDMRVDEHGERLFKGWPTEFSEIDLIAAQAWLNGRISTNVVLLQKEH